VTNLLHNNVSLLDAVPIAAKEVFSFKKKVLIRKLGFKALQLAKARRRQAKRRLVLLDEYIHSDELDDDDYAHMFRQNALQEVNDSNAAYAEAIGEEIKNNITKKVTKRNHSFYATRKEWYRIVNPSSQTPTLKAVMRDGKITYNEKAVKRSALKFFNEFNNAKCDGEPGNAEHIGTKLSTSSINMLSEPISSLELDEALGDLPNGKALGPDGIPYELLKNASAGPKEILLRELNIAFLQGVPVEWSHGRVWLIHKKNSPYDVNNYRQITLLNSALKLLSKILCTRLTKAIEKDYVLTESQGGFRKNRSCVSKIRTLRNVIEDAKCHQRPLYILTIDFEKAFDSICHKQLWKTLDSLKVPNIVIKCIKSMYNQATSDVITDQGVTNKFKIKRGVRQGDILSPLLFNLFIDQVAKNIDALDMGYSFSLNHSVKITELLFTDDIAVVTDDASKLQSIASTL
jgi:hypothetical protein